MDRRVKRAVWMALAMLAVALLLAACGPTPEPTSVLAVSEPTQPPPESTEELAAAEPTQPPEAGALFPSEMPSAVRGREVFVVNCVGCHGAAGDGSALEGAADFTDLEFMRHEKPAEFFEAVRDGVEGTVMPPWGQYLSDMEMWDAVYYAWAFATSPEEIARGQSLFSQDCATCHDAAGDGSGLEGAADFTDQQFMASEDPAEFFEAITGGIDGTAMAAWDEALTGEEVWSLVNYVWTFAYEYPQEAAAPPAEPTEAPPLAEGVLFPPEMPSAVRGGAVYADNCVTCHGEAGDGSGLEGAADFTDLAFMRGEKPAEFFEAIRDGVEGSAMPAWGGTLSDMDIWDVLYYEWAFATSPAEVAQGEGLFGEHCIACHGKAGDGSALEGAANFTDQPFMANEDSNKFFEAIVGGVAGSAMPPWDDVLTESEIWSLVNYLWTFAYEYPEAAETEAEPQPELPDEPDPAVGEQVWQQKPCIGCHGPQAEGGIGPKLAGTVLAFDEVLLRVRVGKAPMPAFAEDEVSELELQHIYAWLRSLAPPTPTPEPDAPTPVPQPALPPREHLMAFWEHVNWVKVHSDFAKDASPNIGALHDRVRQAQERANSALQEADRAIADIPNSQAQATIREVKGFVSEILTHAAAALATQDLNAARAEAASMVEISRLDAWPRASLAVKQAGFTGSVRVRVRDQSGNPIAGALVTALTAPNPAAARTGSDGRVTISDLASVRVMQVKAYSDGLVYHEVHVTVPQGGRADAEITLPGPSTGGQTPAVSNASINPSSGAGNARITFRMTGTDPQGHANIAEDQVFALNPELGVAYVLRSVGGDLWETAITLPNLKLGTHTWYFFIVDHQCNTSNIVPLTYTVQ
jgi:mono/diheme cytochrome c family protein